MTPAPTPELATIFREHGPAYRQAHPMPLYQHRLMHAIETCRTPELGSVTEWCDHCGYTHSYYRSCRNRHCPKCQGRARARWLEARQAELLPIEYFHVVFTIPDEIASIAFHNKEVLYGILFRTTAETLQSIAGESTRLGIQLGFFCVLHSWGQNLHFHPHLHCVVPGGGLSRDRERWVSSHPHFLLPVKALSKRFRQLFLSALQAAYSAGQLQFFGDLAGLTDARAFARYLAPVKSKKWVVYAKPPFGGPAHVLQYLGRYTHRVAISNSRLRNLEDGNVTFEWKDYRHGGTSKEMTVTADDFIRRFLQHSLPPGLQHIRYYGFFANCQRAALTEHCRQLLATAGSVLLPPLQQCRQLYQAITSKPDRRWCPACGCLTLIRLQLPPPKLLNSS